MRGSSWVLAYLVSTCMVHVAFGAYGIDGVTGAEFSPTKPASVVAGENEDSIAPIQPMVFLEAEGTRLSGDLPVDHLNTGASVLAQPILRGNKVNPVLSPGVIDEGSTVNSYFFHFDPEGEPFSASTYNVVIEFSSPVLGVQLFSETFDLTMNGSPHFGTLESGDAAFGSGVDFPSPVEAEDRGVEEDAFMLVIQGNEVLLSGSVFGASVDQVRILTLGSLDPSSAIPEASSLVAWGLLISAIGAFRGRPANRRQR